MSIRFPVRRTPVRALRKPIQRRRADLFKPLFESLESRNLLAMITLSTTLDEVDGNTSSIADLIANPGGTGISLREAIIATNNTASDDIIVVPAGTYVLTIAGTTNTTGDLDILNAGSLQIQGAGIGNSVIDGGGAGGTLADRIFEIQGATVTFEGLTIQNGYLTSSHGAGFYNNGGHVTLIDVQLNNNQAISTGAGDRHGGGFWSRAGSVTGVNVQLTNNQAVRASGTNNGVGGAFWLNEDSQVNFTNLVMTGNQAIEGGGFYISTGNFSGSQVTFTNATIENNVAVVRGGGFRNAGVDGIVTINGGTIRQNIAQDEHGGGFNNSGKVVLNNVDITGNEAQGLDEGAVRDDSYGGGFFNSLSATGTGLIAGIVEITGGSITGNIAYGNGGGFWNRGGLVTITGTALDPVEINNNQAGADSAGQARHGGGFANSDEGTTSLQFVNLDGNKVSTNTSGLFTGVGGGFYNTGNGRVQLNEVTFTNHVANEGGGFYQDGVQSRIIGTNVTVSNNSAMTRGGGFRNATTGGLVQLTNSKIDNNVAQNEHGGGIYNNGSLVLINTVIEKNQALDLDGQVITNLDGGTPTSTGPVQRESFGAGFYNSGGTVQLTGGAIQSNEAYGHGAGFLNTGGVTAQGTVITFNRVMRDSDQLASGNYNRHGGGFRNEADGTVTLTDVQITNNSLGIDTNGNIRGVGGGFYNNGGFVTINGDSKITGNYAEDGGGFYSDSTGSMVTITGTAANRIELSDNKALVRGGGFRSTGNTIVQLSYVDIVGNKTETQRGGGFYGDGAQVIGDHVRISGNVTGTQGRSGDEQGGGFWTDGSGVVSLKSSEISGNFAYANGGGFHSSSAVVELVDSKVTGNISYDNGGGFYSEADSVTRVTRSNIDGNLAGFEQDGKTFGATADRRGGGFWLSGNASAYLVDSTVSGNEAHEYGGGVNMENDTLLVANGTTFSDNVAGNSGGAIRHVSNSRLELTNTTISGNYAGFNRASNGGTIGFD
jgi:fibronectin-binding autotransporter adhesin